MTTSLTAPQRLVLENYIKEILNEKNDIALINENKKKLLKYLATGSILWGVACWSRGSAWHSLCKS